MKPCTELRCPSNAIVATRTATLGQVVQTGTELFRLIQDGRIEVNAQVSEADILKIFPHIGTKPVASITTADALNALSLSS